MEDHGMEAMFTHAGDHPLWKAALSGSKDAVEVALRNTNSFTQTAVLFKALYTGATAAWRILIEKGVPLSNPHIVDCTALGVLFAAPGYVPPLDEVRHLVASGASIMHTNSRCLTPLYIALCTPQLPEVVDFLISSGSEVNAVSSDGYTPLMAAVASNSPHSVEYVRLLLRAGARPNEPRAIVPSLSVCICATWSREKLQLLLEHGAEVTPNQRGSLPPLHIAAHQGNLEAVQMLIAAGAPIDAFSDASTVAGLPPVSALEMAVFRAPDSYELTRLLASPSAALPHRLAPMIVAPLTGGRWQTLRALLDSPIDFSEVLRTQPFIQIALNEDDEVPIEVVEFLLSRGVPATGHEPGTLITPLHAAAKQARADVIRLLLAAGADVDARDSKGRTPLLRAVRSAFGPPTEVLPALRRLLDAGADPNVADMIRGRTPLHWAAFYHLADGIRTLLEYGATQRLDAEGRAPTALALAPLLPLFALEFKKERLP